jgi:hypothetical protein
LAASLRVNHLSRGSPFFWQWDFDDFAMVTLGGMGWLVSLLYVGAIGATFKLFLDSMNERSK